MFGDNVVFVTGMGRSGTSVFSRWLEQCGVDFGAGHGVIEHINPTGNFEDAELKALHRRLHHANGQRSWLTVPLDFEWTVSAQLRAEAESIAARVGAVDTHVGLKDPDSTSFLPLWNELLPGARFILVYRDAAQVVDSVVRMRRRIQGNRRNRVAGLLRRTRYRLDARATRHDQERALSTWIRTNGEAASFLATLPSERVLAVDSAAWPEREDEIFGALTGQLGLHLRHVPAASVLRPGYFNVTPPDVPPFEHLADRRAEVEQLLAGLATRQARG